MYLNGDSNTPDHLLLFNSVGLRVLQEHSVPLQFSHSALALPLHLTLELFQLSHLRVLRTYSHTVQSQCASGL